MSWAKLVGDRLFDHPKALVHADNPEFSAFERWTRDLTALADYAGPDGAEPDPCALNDLRPPPWIGQF